MTLGFLLAIVAGFIWSWVNVIDKTVVGKYIRHPIFMILIFSVVSLIIGLITVPFLSGGFSGTGWTWLIIGSIAYTLGNLLYFYALKVEEASRVVPLFALSTVFVVGMAAVFLGEIFNLQTYIGIVVIIIGSLAITARRNIAYFFKSRGWQRVITCLLGIFVLMIFLKETKQVYVRTRFRHMVLSGLAEVSNTIAALIFLIAIALWYISLVETVVSVQYVFIFLWALLISRFKPSLFAEEVNRRVI